MDKAYRIPKTPEGSESPQSLSTETTPINRMSLRSLFVRPEPGEQLPAKRPIELEGLALDSGLGIQRVEVSSDNGGTWQTTRLDPDLGKYSWRRWRYTWSPAAPGKYLLKVRAFNRSGAHQPTNLWNRSGYMRNVIEQLEVEVV
jgi:hypothetical protein